MKDYGKADASLRDAIICGLARKGQSRKSLYTMLCISPHTFQKKLDAPCMFTVLELRAIAEFLDIATGSLRIHIM